MHLLLPYFCEMYLFLGRTYDVHGGIEHVRVELCVEALREVIKKRKNGITVLKKNDADSEEMTAGYQVALQALLLRCPPRGSRAAFLERSAYPLSSLQRWYTQSINDAIDTDALLLWQASKIVEVRGIDVLLRVLRDDLVLNSARLERSVTNLKQRVQRHANRVYLVKVARDGYVTVVKALVQFVEQLSVSIFRGFGNQNQKKKRGGIALWSALKGLVAATTATLEDDRRYLAIVEAGRDKEMESLGIVQMALFTRPKELSSSYLLRLADKKMKIDDDDTATISSDDGNTSKGSTAPDTAVRLLLLEGDFQEWSEDASQWTQESRETIYNIVSEQVSGIISSTVQNNGDSLLNNIISNDCVMRRDLQTLSDWANPNPNKSNNQAAAGPSERDWLTVLTLVDAVADNSRLSRRSLIEFTVAEWSNKLDSSGIPSQITLLSISLLINKYLYQPYWESFLYSVRYIYAISQGIFIRRFWDPSREIILELLNRKPKLLLDPFEVQNEETSLDNMLRDMKFGDGTPKTRPEALSKASRQYEDEMNGGTLRNLVLGNMVQLLLIQIQQLKTSSLQALVAIDDLVEGNTLNVQLLAVIPAILLVTYGTRILMAGVYSIRSQDLRPTKSVYQDMTDLLVAMERCLLLSRTSSHDTLNTVSTIQVTKTRNANSSSKDILQPRELGEILSLVHSYIRMLDFLCPTPFSTKECDSVHSSLQDLFMAIPTLSSSSLKQESRIQQQPLDTSRQLSLLRLVQNKHAEFQKSL